MEVLYWKTYLVNSKTHEAVYLWIIVLDELNSYDATLIKLLGS